MTRAWTRTLLIGWMAMAGSASAQSHPNFAGTWVLVAPAPTPPSSDGVAAIPPSDLVVQQSADTLALSRTAFDRVTTTTYTFDGREDRNKSGAITRLTRSTWNGATLVTEGRASQVTSQGYSAWSLKEILSIDGRGRLVIDYERTGEDGAVTRSTQTYAKKAAK